MNKTWVLGIFAAVALTVAACGGSDNKSGGGILGGNNSGSSSTSATAVAGGGGGPPSTSATKAPAGGSGSSSSSTGSPDVDTALSNLIKAKSFKGKVTVEGGQFKGDGSVEVVTPDKFHLTFNGGGLGNIEMIAIGSTTYTKTGSAWSKSTGGTGSIGIDPTSLTKQVTTISKTAKVTKGSTDKVNGKTCQIYSLDDSATKSKTELCIADSLPLRFVVSGTGSKVTMVFSDFNSNIDIKAPI